jgi:cytochrome c oxidase subunit 2
VLLFVRPPWWLPEAISEHARAYDSHLILTFWVIGVLFTVAQGLLAFAVFRFRDRGQTASPVEGSSRLELLWTSVTAVIFLALAAAGQGIWASVHLQADPHALRIEVLAKQFAWSYRYPGADGNFSNVEAASIDDTGGNPFGIVDPKSDDVVSALLHVPSDRSIELRLKSRDVIHNFFVRELRIKQDVVPGMTIPLRFRANKPGRYEIPCSELCGLGHHQMRSALVVMRPEEFEAWLREQQNR